VALSAASVLLLLVPAVGSVYPVPSWPVNIFPYIFLAYVAIGLIWFMLLRRRPNFAQALIHRVSSEHQTSAPTAEVVMHPAVEKPKRALA
jgi:hypothetical protein